MAHHFDLSILEEFPTSERVGDLSNIFYNISWDLAQFSGRKKRRENSSEEFVRGYGEISNLEDFATVFGSLTWGEIQEKAREYMKEGKFELAVKLLVGIYLAGYENGRGSLYNYNYHIKPLTIEEVEENINQARERGISIPEATLESFNALKVVFNKLREKENLNAITSLPPITPECFPTLYPELSVFVESPWNKIKNASRNWQQAVEGLNQLLGIANLADFYQQEIANLIRDKDVNPLFKKILTLKLDKDKLEDLILDKDIGHSLARIMALKLLETASEKELLRITENLVEKGNISLARFIIEHKIESKEEIEYLRQEKGPVDWENMENKLLLLASQIDSEQLEMGSKLPDIKASALTAEIITRLIPDDDLITEIERIDSKEVYRKLKQVVLNSSLLYEKIRETMEGKVLEVRTARKESIEPDLKHDIWEILNSQGQLLTIADFDNLRKTHLEVKDFGSFNVFENDLTQRAVEYFSTIKYGTQGYGLGILYDVDSPNPAMVGFWMKTQKIDARNYKYLILHIKGNPLWGHPHKIKIEIKNDKGEVGSYYLKGINSSWQEFVIPLSEFEGISDFGSLNEFVIVFDKDELNTKVGGIYLDLIGLSTTSLEDKNELKEYLITAVETGNERLKEKAINALGRLRITTPGIKEILIQGLTDPLPKIREVSAEAIGRLTITEARADLISLLNDQNQDVRLGAFMGLIALNAHQPLLPIALDDGDWRIRKLAISTMDKQKVIELKDKLQFLAENDTSWQVRVEAIFKLSEICNINLLQGLENLLKKDNPWVRLAVLCGLWDHLPSWSI
jgi:hypothetical protein